MKIQAWYCTTMTVVIVTRVVTHVWRHFTRYVMDRLFATLHNLYSNRLRNKLARDRNWILIFSLYLLESNKFIIIASILCYTCFPASYLSSCGRGHDLYIIEFGLRIYWTDWETVSERGPLFDNSDHIVVVCTLLY